MLERPPAHDRPEVPDPAGAPSRRVAAGELRAALEARDQENTLLMQLLRETIADQTPARLLRQIIAHLQAALPCRAAFIYLWDAAQERLVLRGASDRYAQYVGRISMRLDEGLAGWAARTGEPVMLRERAIEDARFRYFPELEEERYQAMLTVPMRGSDGAIEAVISMHTIAPQEFTEEHAHLVGALAPILGSGIAAARLHEQTLRTLDVVSHLSGLIGSLRPIDEALPALADTAQRATASAYVALVLAEPGRDTLSLHVFGDARREHTTLSQQPWEAIARRLEPGGAQLPGLEMPQDLACMVSPLVAGGKRVGMLACYRQDYRPYGGDDLALLEVIADQVAIAVKNSQLAELLAERDAPARLFQDLRQGPGEAEDLVRRRAALLGCDLGQPHLPLVLEPVGTAKDERRLVQRRVAARLHSWLDEGYPGSLVHADVAMIQALVRLPPALVGAEFPSTELARALERDAGVAVRGGFGRACRRPGDYARGFAEAHEALRVERILAQGSVVSFDALGVARYLSAIPRPEAGDDLQDRYQDGVAALVAHDERRGTTLVETLDVYLGCGGSLARAAARLYVHRNTLVQRLEKIHELTGFDPRESDHWLALQVVIKLSRLWRSAAP